MRPADCFLKIHLVLGTLCSTVSIISIACHEGHSIQNYEFIDGGNAFEGKSLEPVDLLHHRARREVKNGFDNEHESTQDGVRPNRKTTAKSKPTKRNSSKSSLLATERPTITKLSKATTSKPKNSLSKGPQSTTRKAQTNSRPAIVFNSLTDSHDVHTSGAPEVGQTSWTSTLQPTGGRTSVAPPSLRPSGVQTSMTPSTPKPTSGHTSVAPSSPRPMNVQTSVAPSTPKPIGDQTSASPSTATPVADPTAVNNSSISYERDVTYFLESHPAHSIHDPRAFFTEERSTRSLAVMLQELDTIQKELRFSFMVRAFAELGRKIASKLNRYSEEVVAVLSKLPDGLGNKPDVNMLVDVVDKIFDSKEDQDPKNGAESTSENEIRDLIARDKDKETLFNASLHQLAIKFGIMIGHFSHRGCGQFMERTEPAADLLAIALKLGANEMITELSKSDKHRVCKELINITNQVLTSTSENFKKLFLGSETPEDKSITEHINWSKRLGFRDLNAISDKTGLVGPWNSYLFSNLGSSERVIKLFASLLSRVPNSSKTKWINMYWASMQAEWERTMPSFVSMQLIPRTNSSSQQYLLNPSRIAKILPKSLPVPREDYVADKNRLPYRCYLAGRRWRLVLLRAMREYPLSELIVSRFCERLGLLKSRTMGNDAEEPARLCLPRLDIGLRGWAFNGDPNVNSGSKRIRSPLGELASMDDPFIAGVKLGFNIGFKVGYNERRNATLEMEQMNSSKKQDPNKVSAELRYLSIASYRRGATAGARMAFGLAIREGYLTTLRVSLRAGWRIPAESASHISAYKGKSFGGQTGLEAGRAIVNRYLLNKDIDELTRKSYVKLGETHGTLGGETLGEAVGAIVGKEAAEEAFKRSINRGSKIAKAKFHLTEYEAGAKAGFEQGYERGGKVASSSTLDPAAPKFLRLPKPSFNLTDSPDADEVDHWEKDLVPKLSTEVLDLLHMNRNHTMLSGSLKGVYNMTKEVKKGLSRRSFTNQTFRLHVQAEGFIADDIAYLTLNGSINEMSFLRGFLVVRDLFSD